MPATHVWRRGLTSLTAWSLLTAASATGAGLGLAAVTDNDHDYRHAATVLQTPGTDTAFRNDSGSSDSLKGWIMTGKNAYVRTFGTAGGTVAMRASAQGVSLVAASPAAGYRAVTDHAEPHHYSVTFHSDDDPDVTVEAMWRDGRPFGRITPK